jgi:hypothetical protein
MSLLRETNEIITERLEGVSRNPHRDRIDIIHREVLPQQLDHFRNELDTMKNDLNSIDRGIRDKRGSQDVDAFDASAAEWIRREG